ncbi:MAG: nucleotidyl transferase AbiEii/AbiGii toxin family protein [bacterium]|nr:nucleotidyl transferase AbiEii/AbiGii toxin family protein [bacterium]
MNYRTPEALSQAITAHLHSEATRLRVPFSRLHRAIAFDRLLAHLQTAAPDSFLVKGGVALDYRFTTGARPTKDIDLSVRPGNTLEALLAHFRDAARVDLGDHFSIRVASEPEQIVEEVQAYRFRIDVLLGSRVFESLTVDVGLSDPWLAGPERISAPSLLAFAEIAAAQINVIPLEQHAAEKLHAYTRTYAGTRASTRVKDLVDLVLIATTSVLDGRRLHIAVAAVFEQRATHKLPATLPAPPASWRQPFRRLTETLEITRELGDGHRLAAALLGPILNGRFTAGTWDPRARDWQAAPDNLT